MPRNQSERVPKAPDAFSAEAIIVARIFSRDFASQECYGADNISRGKWSMQKSQPGYEAYVALDSRHKDHFFHKPMWHYMAELYRFYATEPK